MFTIETDPPNKLVHAILGGMMDRDEVVRFGHEEQAAVRSMGLGSGEFVLLVETTGNLIQTQDVMEAFRALIANAPLKAGRIATVRDGVLTRMQARRLMKERNYSEVFNDVAEARAWLLDD